MSMVYSRGEMGWIKTKYSDTHAPSPLEAEAGGSFWVLGVCVGGVKIIASSCNPCPLPHNTLIEGSNRNSN